jgi:glycopeptide antibiotics resistance protein
MTLNEKLAEKIIFFSSLHGLKDEITKSAIPFWYHHSQIKCFWLNFIGNLLLFFPLSALLYLALPAWKKKGVWIFVFCAVLSVSIEFFQYFIPYRLVDLSDVLSNIFGSLLGIKIVSRAIH